MTEPARTHLTPRLLHTLRLVAAGATNTAIGHRLNISTSTAAARVLRLRHRLGARDRANAVAIAYQLGLLHVGVDNGTPPCRCGTPAAVVLPGRLHELLYRAARGETVDEAATAMGAARSTVAVHARRLYLALDARSQAHAVALGYEMGLLRRGDVQPAEAARRAP